MAESTTLVCGTGDWSGPKPGDPDNNVTLSAVAKPGGIEISFSYPLVNAHAVAHVRLLRSASSSFAMASLRAIVNGNIFFDSIPGNGTTYFYWIEIVSINGTINSAIGPVSATSTSEASFILNSVYGKIDDGYLAQSLKTEIASIKTWGADLEKEIADRIAEGSLYGVAFQQLNDDVNDSLAFVGTMVDAIATENSALASQIQLVQSELDGNLASAQTQLETQITTIDGKVTQIGALYTAKVSVNGLIGGFGIYNDGSFVDAGFDVDRFWVGRSIGDSVKPFVIEDGVVYIHEARIGTATIGTTKIALEAVNAPRSSGSDSIFYGNGTWTTRLSIFIPSGAEKYSVIAKCQLAVTANYQDIPHTVSAHVRLIDDFGTIHDHATVTATSTNYDGNTTTVVALIGLGVNSGNYHLQFSGPGQVSGTGNSMITRMRLLGMGVKR